MTKKKNTLILIVIIVIISTMYTLASLTIFSAVKEDSVVYIPSKSTIEQRYDNIGKNINSINLYKIYSKATGLNKIIPGRYELKKGMSYFKVLRMFGRGRQTPVNLTFNNIRTPERLAGVISKYIEPDSIAVISHLLNDSIAAKYGFTPQVFISMFIPNTYQFYWTTTLEQFTDKMKREYDKFWNEERKSKASALGLTPTEVVILASIVTEETQKEEDVPMIGQVYLNRLKIGMPLQACPTVKFALGDFTIRRVTGVHLAVNSPYNTYKNRGLPPGPICIPSIRVVDAILGAQKHNYLYFSAKADFSGYHNFAKTYDQHIRNSAPYIRELTKRNIK